MYRCDCGKEFEKSQSYNAHQGRCPINRKNRNRVVVDTLNKDGPWNKGLSSEDPRIKDLSKKISSSLKGKSHPQSDITKLKISRSMKLVGGGYRKGSGRGKKGWYKGYWCDSSWELAYVVYNIDHNIPFRRNHDYFLYEYDGKTHKYYPDFIEEGKYIEIKGFLRSNDPAKFKSVPNLVVITPEDINKYLDYVVSTYGCDYTKLYNS